MRKVTIVRDPAAAPDTEGTTGKLRTDSGLELYTGELPARGNARNISRVNAGTYTCRMRDSKKHGRCYGLLNVDGHDDVEIHIGNWFGDTAAGKKSDVLGCVIVGNAIGELSGQKALIGSGDAYKRFMADMAGADFELTISQS